MHANRMAKERLPNRMINLMEESKRPRGRPRFKFTVTAMEEYDKRFQGPGEVEHHS